MTDKFELSAAIRRYGAELVIVFVGVYAAFWVDNYREEQARVERFEQVRQTLIADLDDQVRVGNQIDEAIDNRLAEWSSAHERGEKPAPYVLRINRSERPPISTWEAVSRSDIIDLLDPSLVFDLGFFYSEADGVGDKFIRYAEFTDTYVMPGLKRGNEWFYDEETGELKPEFSAHMDRLRDYQKDTSELVEWAQCLSDRLATGTDETESCRPIGDWVP